jgi:hypothetical protein
VHYASYHSNFVSKSAQEQAFEENQKYKEGKFIVEKALVRKVFFVSRHIQPLAKPFLPYE